MELRPIEQLAEDQRDLFLHDPGTVVLNANLKAVDSGRFDVDPDFRNDPRLFARIERVVDGFLDGGEILVDVMLPEVLYTERMTITLGGKTVELIHPGPSHSTDTTVLLFPEQRTIYGVDFLNVQRLAFGFPGDGTLQQWIDSLRAVEALDFDIVSPGHSTVGTKEDLAAYREYFEDLQAVVTDAVDSGTTLVDLLSSDVLTDYSDLPNYDPQRDRNIEEAYNLLTQ